MEVAIKMASDEAHTLNDIPNGNMHSDHHNSNDYHNNQTNGNISNDIKEGFSWQKPHVNFAVILVGPQEVPFGVQVDFLCTKSAFWRRHLAQQEKAGSGMEAVLRLPDCSPEVFGLAQNFMYEGGVYSEGSRLPNYDALFGAWKLGESLEIDGLCDNVIQAMKELRRITQRVPATPLLVEVWRDTPKGSTIRALLLEWTSEYMRASASREQFATELPHGVLTELVVKMANNPLFEAGSEPAPPAPSFPAPASPRPPPAARAKNVHYLSDDSADEISSRSRRALKRQSTGSILTNPPASTSRLARKSDAELISLSSSRQPLRPIGQKIGKRRPNTIVQDASTFTTAQKLNFCQDLITRMLSGPGFWTRLVGPFKQPVDPETDGVPDYFDKVKRPMDLSTIKLKMDRNEYRDELQFLADIRQVFQNCYAYWAKGDSMFTACERLEKTFEDKYGQMARWISKMEGQEE
jgi:hypothetical protein